MYTGTIANAGHVEMREKVVILSKYKPKSKFKPKPKSESPQHKPKKIGGGKVRTDFGSV